MLALVASVCFCALQLGSANDLGDTVESDFHCPPTAALAGKAFRVPVQEGYFLPVLANKNRNSRQHLAVLVLHGSTRNVEEYYTNMVTVSTEVCGGFSTVVIAAAIPSVSDGSECTGADWGGGATSEKALTWSGTREWALGQNDDRVEGGVSSFLALDKVIEWAIQSWWRSLRAIVITGFSTGAQLALRWAIFSAEGENGMTATKNPRGSALPLRMVVSSPSSFTYLSNMRPSLNCTEDELTTRDFRCDDFAVPETGSRRRGKGVQKTCSGKYDDYQYGLAGLSGATPGTAAADVADYLGDFMTTNAADVPAALRARFTAKDIRFLAGTEDTKFCGDGSCADSCEAMTQGSNRLQRSLNYAGHVENVTGKAASIGIFNGPHNHLLAYRSDEFLDWGFPGLIDETTGECDIESQVDGATSLLPPRFLAALALCLGFTLPLAR